MATNYVPTTDATLGPWLENAATLATAAPGDFGLVAGDAVILTAQSDAWAAAYAPTTSPSTRTPATISNKDAVKASVLATVRPYFVAVSLNAAVTDENKTAFGCTVRKTVPTPVPPPTTRPVISVTGATPGVLQMRYADSELPTGKSKPAGVIGVDIWTAAGTVYATSVAQAGYKETYTKSPFNITFDPSLSGKLVSIWARYRTRGGAGGQVAYGPWSDQLNTVIV